jgi:predicted permease
MKLYYFYILIPIMMFSSIIYSLNSKVFMEALPCMSIMTIFLSIGAYFAFSKDKYSTDPLDDNYLDGASYR